MKNVRLSSLVVSCKDYKPAYNWYLRRSDGYYYGTANHVDDMTYDEETLREYEESDDYVLLPECPGMTDDDAAEVLKQWCALNNITYVDDMDDIENTYKGYYGYF